jgi:hypothetical protein
MDRSKYSIFPNDLYARPGSDAAPIVVDVGRYAEIAGADRLVAPALVVRATDDKFTVSLDGIWLFTGFNKTLSRPGCIALWSKGDSITRFDQIEIAPLP